MFDPAGRSAPQVRRTAKDTAEADEIKIEQQQMDKAATETGRLRFGTEALPATRIGDREFFATPDEHWSVIAGMSGYTLTNDPARLDEAGIDAALADRLRRELG